MATEPLDSSLRRVLPYAWIVVGLAALYVGYTFYSRWQDARNLENKAKQQEAAAAEEVVNRFGGTSLKVLQFYASPGEIRRGETVKLCYGASNAKTVKIEPSVGETWPSLSRCLDAQPRATTRYIFTAMDDKGGSASESLEVRVR